MLNTKSPVPSSLNEHGACDKRNHNQSPYAADAVHDPRQLSPTQISASLAQVLVVDLQTNYSRTVIGNVGELNVTIAICVIEAEHEAVGSSIVHGSLNGDTIVRRKLVRTI
jgi:hypothetical protein